MTSWFKKLGLGLQKSSAKISSGISGIFNQKKLSADNLDELEELLISTDMGIKASAEIISRLSARKFDKEAAAEDIRRALAEEIEQIILPCEKHVSLGSNNPEVVLFVGVNGAGKTTAIGKLAAKFSHLQTSLIAADTFRAAAVEQLKIWGKRNNVRVYSGAPGSDAAGLCFEGLNEALKQKDRLIFIDTAGRLQNKTGLMDELKKIIRVIQKVIPEAPHHIWLCLDATTGQNALDQAKIFKDMVEVNGVIVNKLDGSAKGGVLVAVAAETRLPVLYIGVGEGIDDLDVFNARDFSRSLVGVD